MLSFKFIVNKLEKMTCFLVLWVWFDEVRSENQPKKVEIG